MTKSMKIIAISATALTLAGCTIGKEAGSQIDNGYFGNATMHNTLAQTCYPGGLHGYKGAVVADPVVVLDPGATPTRPIYRVYCNGQLDGRYARVIGRSYIASAGTGEE